MTLGATGAHARCAQLRYFVGQDAEAGAPYPSDYPPDKFAMIHRACPRDIRM